MNSNELWDHQKQCIVRASEDGLDEFGLFFDPGTGKTRTTIEILRMLFNRHRRIFPTLIFGPPIVLENWKDEFKMFSKINPRIIYPLYGKISERIQALRQAIEENGRGLIVITNYDALDDDKFFKALLEFKPEICIADESQKIKDHKSKRAKKVVRIGDSAFHRYILSGSPILNSPMDAYHQFRFLDKGATFGRNFFVFRNTYFIDKNAGMPKDKYFPDWVIRPEALDRLHHLMMKKSMVVKKSDCLDLPPLLRKRVDVELSKEQARLYSEMKKNFVAFLNTPKGDKAVVADLAITKALRLQQIITGVVKLSDEHEPIILDDTPREKALKDLLESICEGHKVLVWAVFVPNYEIIRRTCERLNIEYREAHGGTSTEAKKQAVYDFNNDPNVRVFIGHPLSLGIGINLVAASYSIFFSRNFSLENDLQSEARNYRGGSEIHDKITRIDLVAKGTIDELILEALENKKSVADAILTIKERFNNE
jgi:SNF2 family DNA or RNA helicase